MCMQDCLVFPLASIAGFSRVAISFTDTAFTHSRPISGARKQRQSRVMAAGIALLLLCVAVASLHQQSARTGMLGLETWVASKREQSIAMAQSNVSPLHSPR